MWFKNKYRIVTDRYAGYEVQKRRWYFPFWLQVNFTNTSLSIEMAKTIIEGDKGRVVYREG